MIQLLNNLAIFVGYFVLAVNAIAGSIIVGQLWIDEIRKWFRKRQEARDRLEAAKWVPDEITLRRQMRSKVG